MKSLGLDYRSGIATAAVSLPVFLIGNFILAVFITSSVPALFSVLILTAMSGTVVLAIMQGVWTRKTYVKRLQNTTRALEEISQGKWPEQLHRERHVLCADIRQCPEDRTILDCLACDCYSAQSDLDRLAAIINTLGNHVEALEAKNERGARQPSAALIDLQSGKKLNPGRGFVRRDQGWKPLGQS